MGKLLEGEQIMIFRNVGYSIIDDPLLSRVGLLFFGES